nr:vacuolar cation/proton exchanger 3-like [Ipomoea batatas]
MPSPPSASSATTVSTATGLLSRAVVASTSSIHRCTPISIQSRRGWNWKIQKMLEEFITGSLVLILGYAYPALECFKSVENRVDIAELRFWCQYWSFSAPSRKLRTCRQRCRRCTMRCSAALFTAAGLVGENNAEDSDEEEIPEIQQWEAIGWLAILTLWISVLSGYLVDAIEGASESMNMHVSFISVILLPIVGNAAEHASAIMFAMKDKLDISLGVAIGSSTQISMFLVPFCVVVGWFMGKDMDLNFQLFETATLFIAVLVVAFMLQSSSSHAKAKSPHHHRTEQLQPPPATATASSHHSACSSESVNGGQDIYSCKESGASSLDHLVVMVHGILGR